jgi:hypothetical protein
MVKERANILSARTKAAAVLKQMLRRRKVLRLTQGQLTALRKRHEGLIKLTVRAVDKNIEASKFAPVLPKNSVPGSVFAMDPLGVAHRVGPLVADA